MRTVGQILVVDHDPVVQTILRCFVACTPFSDVLVATDGSEAKEMLALEFANIRVIIADINSPELDGVELFRHLDGRKYSGSLLLCGWEYDANVRSTIALAKTHGIGCTEFMPKPLTKRKLDEQVRPLLELPEVPLPAWNALNDNPRRARTDPN